MGVGLYRSVGIPAPNADVGPIVDKRQMKREERM